MYATKNGKYNVDALFGNMTSFTLYIDHYTALNRNCRFRLMEMKAAALSFTTRKDPEILILKLPP